MRRRDFITLGTGILFACRLDVLSAFQARGQMPRLNYATDFNAYLHIGRDGRVTCYVGRVEMGQGNMTSLAQLVAEELEVAVNAIDMVMGDTERCPWDLGTFGSMSIAVFGPALRRAAAEAREVLRDLASDRLSIPADELIAARGAVHGRLRPDVSISYADLAGGAAIPRHKEAPPLKAGGALSVLGQSAPRLDAFDKVTGRAVYAGDVRLPELLYARVLRPPAHEATLLRVDTSAAARVPGVRVVHEGDFVAVLHERPDEAARALGLIAAEFARHAPPIDDTTIFDHLRQSAPPGETVASIGDLAEGARLGVTTFDETYRNAYVAHAPMETHTAVAQVEGGAVTVWASTQAPFIVKQQIMEALDLPAGKVHVITPYVGGGFGGKTAGPQAVEASRLAQISGRPVQVAWNRAEEFFFDTFRPAALMRVKSAVDAAGRIVLWDCDVFGAGDGGAAPFYDIPHQRVVSHGGWQSSPPGVHPFGVGAWRAPAYNSNTFAREVQMDLMAAEAGIDPLAFRMSHLTDPRMRSVLETAARRFGWTPAKSPSGRGVGVACGVYASTYVATLAEVRVDHLTGRVSVDRVVCAQDMGQVVNPEGARTQIEGCVTMGLGYALGEGVRFKDGAVLDRNFDTYRIPVFSALPRIDAVIVDAPDRPASAGGEPAIICMGAVIANAIHDATGARLRDLPMTPSLVKHALEVVYDDRHPHPRAGGLQRAVRPRA